MIEILLGVIAVAIFVYYILPVLLVLMAMVLGVVVLSFAVAFEWLQSLWKS